MKTINIKHVLVGALILIVVAITLMSFGGLLRGHAAHKGRVEALIRKKAKEDWQQLKSWVEKEDRISDWVDE